MKRVIITADDFGLSDAVNDGVEQAHRQGVLTSASLMVAGAAAADAVRRARRMPALAVGLHLTLVEGTPVLPREAIPALVDADGQIGSAQFALGLRYFFSPAARRQLAAEIDAQFAAFAATGLPLDHANAHKHMHLHPTVGRMMIAIGARYGLRAIRVPREPLPIVVAAGRAPTIADRAVRAWSAILRRQARRAGLAVTDAVLGLAWSGGMTEDVVLRLAAALPDGLTEIYFHPAARRDAVLDRLMPRYQHEAERDALCSPAVRAALSAASLTTYGALAAAPVVAAPSAL